MRDEFNTLLQQYLTDSITPEAHAQLREWMAQQEYQPVLTAFIDGQLEENALAGEENLALREASFARLESRINRLQRARRRIVWLRATAVAAILLLLAGALWLWQPAHRALPRLAVKAALLPGGGNKAMLTLSDGRVVTLDSTQHIITDAGGVQVINRGDGLLSYADAPGNAVVSYNTLATPRGGQYQVVLPDGTQVWLNAASELRYPTRFTGNSREVTLTGEAYFEVAQLANQPFRVNAADLAVTVLGTGFNIMAYQNEEAVHATLVQGSVKVSSTRMPQQTGIVLTPGQQASAVPGGAITVNRPDLNEVLSWKEGSFSFSKTSLQAIMRQIERWYDVEVVYEGSMPDFHFTGNFSRRQYASQLLEILEASGEVNFTIEKDKIIVKRGKR